MVQRTFRTKIKDGISNIQFNLWLWGYVPQIWYGRTIMKYELTDIKDLWPMLRHYLDIHLQKYRKPQNSCQERQFLVNTSTAHILNHRHITTAETYTIYSNAVLVPLIRHLLQEKFSYNHIRPSTDMTNWTHFTLKNHWQLMRKSRDSEYDNTYTLWTGMHCGSDLCFCQLSRETEMSV